MSLSMAGSKKRRRDNSLFMTHLFRVNKNNLLPPTLMRMKYKAKKTLKDSSLSHLES